MDPQLLEVETGSVKRLMTGGRYYGAEVSPDGKHLLIVELNGNTDQNIFVYNLETGEHTNATEHEKETVFWPGPWKKRRQRFFTSSPTTGVNTTAWRFTASSAKTWDWVYTPEADVEHVVVPETGDMTLYNVNVAGGSQLHTGEHSEGNSEGSSEGSSDEQSLPELPSGIISDLDLKPRRQQGGAAFLETARSRQPVRTRTGNGGLAGARAKA